MNRCSVGRTFDAANRMDAGSNPGGPIAFFSVIFRDFFLFLSPHNSTSTLVGTSTQHLMVYRRKSHLMRLFYLMSLNVVLRDGVFFSEVDPEEKCAIETLVIDGESDGDFYQQVYQTPVKSEPPRKVTKSETEFLSLAESTPAFKKLMKFGTNYILPCVETLELILINSSYRLFHSRARSVSELKD